MTATVVVGGTSQQHPEQRQQLPWLQEKTQLSGEGPAHTSSHSIGQSQITWPVLSHSLKMDLNQIKPTLKRWFLASQRRVGTNVKLRLYSEGDGCCEGIKQHPQQAFQPEPRYRPEMRTGQKPKDNYFSPHDVVKPEVINKNFNWE